jgi:polysaccharide biosynthesis transport protein
MSSVSEDPSAVLFLVAQEQPRITAAKGDTSDDFRVYRENQQQLVKSRFVIVAALRKPEIQQLPMVKRQKAPVTWLMRELRVDFPGNAGVMRLRLPAVSGQEGATLLNAVAKAYLSEVVDKDHQARAVSLAELDKIMAATDAQLRDERVKLRQFAESEHVIPDPKVAAYRGQIAITELSAAETESRKTRASLAAAEGELDARRKSAESAMEPSESEIDVAAQTDLMITQVLIPLMAQIRKQLLDAEVRPVPTGSPPVEKLQASLKKVQTEIAARRAELQKDLQRRKGASLEADIRGVEAQIKALKALEGRCEERQKRLREEAHSFSVRSVDVDAKAERVRQLERVFSQLAEQRELLKVEQNAPSRVTLIQEAVPPD